MPMPERDKFHLTGPILTDFRKYHPIEVSDLIRHLPHIAMYVHLKSTTDWLSLIVGSCNANLATFCIGAWLTEPPVCGC